MADHVALETQPQAAMTAPRPVMTGEVPSLQASANQAVATSPQAKPISGQILPPPKRKGKRRVLMTVVLLGGLGGGGYLVNEYFTNWQFLVSTDDAYVRADMSIIAAKVSGYIQSVSVSDNTHVAAGDVLARIDDGDYKLAVRAAQDKITMQDATIARIAQQEEAQKANIAQAEAGVTGARADALRASLAYDRALALAKSNYETKATLDQTLADRDRTAATVLSAVAAVTSAKSNLDVFTAQKNEAQTTRASLVTALAQAQRDLDFTVIRAPFDGVVGNKAAQPGQFVSAGTRLLALVPLQSAYVEANFKETQLAHMVPGQKADVSIDALPDHSIEGVVESFAPASGSQYSLLPPENATGNFTKIVQRVPVRIKVPAEVASQGLLRPGLSVVVSVHTRDERLPKPTLWSALGLDKLDLSRFGIGTSARADVPLTTDLTASTAR